MIFMSTYDQSMMKMTPIMLVMEEDIVEHGVKEYEDCYGDFDGNDDDGDDILGFH